ncbi:uncharacterized protein PgNI_02659 [Pyricularia grisea]|uniref:Zn(2)-C6 fungal-type domain-containing protein n=1 Tax=Pyricularia grisea TaxID=148305 RepID=A0A6P8BER6_PYRGI|nr:uncharacterized protein PgNI_02659 [Pyricularia grisea]TLD14187.1 hypothetical protein PgNI_02659 [Pyricularia grisea]
MPNSDQMKATSPAASSPAAAVARPPKRTSNTCNTCRARKVRCDGRRDVCTNCERLGFGCTYHDAGPGSGSTEGETAMSSALALALPRRRVRLACANCHSRKARCSGSLPKCDRCRARGIECVYQPGKRARPSSVMVGESTAPTSTTPDRPGSGNGPARDDRVSVHSRSHSSDRDVTSVTSPSNFGQAAATEDEDAVLESIAPRAFEQFFRHIHHIPVFSFLHRASLMQRYHSGLIDRGLLLALIGITSLLTDLGSGTRDFGVRCIDEAETTVLGELEKPSTLKLQTLVLIIKHRILMRRFPSAFMLHAVASRFAVALRLNHENPRLCFLAQESRRRLMWAVYMIDTGIAAGHPDFGLWENKAPSNIRIQLPCNERNFDFDLPEVTEPLEQPAPGPDGVIPPMTDDIGFLALHIRVCLLRSRILQYTKNMIHGSPTPEQIANLPARFAELESQLGAFASRLPVSFNWSEANVRLRAYSPRLCVFVMTHLLWEQCHIDLYRVAAHSGVSRDALPQTIMARIEASHPGFAGICRRQIFEHARAMADMFSLLLTLDGVPVTDMDLPVCLYQCARMLYLSLHTSGVEFGITTESVQEMGNVCLRVLKQTITAPAAMGIRADLERLLATGIPSDLAPSIPDSPEIPMGGARNPVPSLLTQNILSNTMNTVQYQSPIAASLPNGGQTFPQTAVTGTPFQAATEPPLAQLDQPATAPATATATADEPKSPSVASLHPSNAFDGPFDGLDFNMDQFGMDSQSWYSTEWLGGDFSSAAGQAAT